MMEILGALYQLARLAVITRFAFKGPYWRWRLHTAFGNHRPSPAQAWASILEYGRWVHRMRRGMMTGDQPGR